MSRLFVGPDGQSRCHWCQATPEYIAYHDREWGFPVGEDRRLFEKVCLEGFQSGLSWRTILTKRENFRRAFHGFEIARVAAFGAEDVERLLQDAGIVRHRGKIEAAINNAQRALELIEEEGSLAEFFWGFASPAGSPAQTVSTTPQSVALSKELKRRGWKFVGPTTVYSLMQASGMVNDHADGCFAREQVEEARRAFPALQS